MKTYAIEVEGTICLKTIVKASNEIQAKSVAEQILEQMSLFKDIEISNLKSKILTQGD